MLHRELKKLISLHHPETCAVEKLFFQRNVSTAIAVGQARGVMMLSMAEAGLDVAEYTPERGQTSGGWLWQRAEETSPGNGARALALPEIPKPDDAADALAIAITHLHTKRF